MEMFSRCSNAESLMSTRNNECFILMKMLSMFFKDISGTSELFLCSLEIIWFRQLHRAC